MTLFVSDQGFVPQNEALFVTYQGIVPGNDALFVKNQVIIPGNDAPVADVTCLRSLEYSQFFRRSHLVTADTKTT